MSNREILCEMGYEDSVVFDNPDYDAAIVGVNQYDGAVIYDYDLMVECLVNEGMTAEEAIEFIDYNTIRSLPYVQGPKPIIFNRLWEI